MLLYIALILYFLSVYCFSYKVKMQLKWSVKNSIRLLLILLFYFAGSIIFIYLGLGLFLVLYMTFSLVAGTAIIHFTLKYYLKSKLN